MNKIDQNSWSHLGVYILLGREGDRQLNNLVTYIAYMVVINVMVKNKSEKGNRQGPERVLLKA